MQILAPEYVRKDNRGSLIQVTTQPFKQLNILEINKGSGFGGHYHKCKTEIFYVIKGMVKLNDSQVFLEGTCFEIELFDRHTIVALEDSILAETLSEPYEKKDVFI